MDSDCGGSKWQSIFSRCLCCYVIEDLSVWMDYEIAYYHSSPTEETSNTKEDNVFDKLYGGNTVNNSKTCVSILAYVMKVLSNIFDTVRLQFTVN